MSGVVLPKADAVAAEPTRRAESFDDLAATAARESPTANADSADRHTVIASPAEIISSAPTEVGRQAGRYRILHSHARGGLGEVFVARDDELGRQVALKEIQPQYAHVTDSRARFIREAEITGHLEHPGVVPVYGLGSYPDGRPFYAMRFIRGRTLHEAIVAFQTELKRVPFERLAVAFRQLIGRFVVVCQTMAYAHSRGVVHRDLKPANIMLGDYGEVLIVDWGLAKRLDRSGEVDAEAVARTRSAFGGTDDRSSFDASSRGSRGTETMSGAVLGTPAYMSPEQARGDWPNVGPASDVYSLGATLYALLTGRPPIAPAAWPDQLAMIEQGRFPPPRELVPAVPRPLDAVCRKAMALRPEDRYASAADLAVDLEHWLADEPVRAYREPWTDRARRFARRHRTAVAGSFAAVFVGLVSLAIAAGLLGAKNAELARQRDLAEEQRRQTRAALDDMTSLDAVDFLGARQELSDGQRQFLERALRYYQRFAEDVGGDPASRRQAAEAQARVGILLHRLGDLGRAGPAFDRATAVLESLVGEFAAPADRAALARILTMRAKVRRDQGMWDAAAADLTRAAGLGGDLMDDPSSPAEVAADLRETFQQLGLLRWTQRRLDEAEPAYARALQLGERLTAADPTSPEARRKLAVIFNELGGLLRDRDKPAEAEAAYRRGLDLREQLEREWPTDAAVRRELAYSYVSLGRLLRSRHDAAGAEATYRKAAERFERLAAQFPGIADYRRELMHVLRELAPIYRGLTRPGDAEAAARRAVQLGRQLVEDQPESPDARFDLGDSLAALARTIAGARPDEAEQLHRDAIALFEQLAAEHDRPEIRLRLAGALENLAVFQRAARKPADAADSFRRAIAVLEPHLTRWPDDAATAVRLAECRTGLGHLERGRQPAEAATAYTRALEALGRFGNRDDVARAKVAAFAGRAAANNALRRPAAAADDFGAAAELCPPGSERDKLRLGRVTALRLSNDLERAAAEALDLTADPSVSPEILQPCAWVVAAAPGRAAEAVRLLRRAAERGQTDLRPAFQGTMFAPLRGRADFAELLWDIAEWAEPPRYEYRIDHDVNGTGKFYRGREIARVMGHQAADWLDRPEREEEERPSKLLDLLRFRRGERVADVGAGTGYHALRIARLVGPEGRVFAVDIQPEMLAAIRDKAGRLNLTNVEPVRGEIDDPKLPAGSVDTVLMVDVYHEFSHPYEMMEGIVKALKPGGRVVFVEFRAEDPAVPIKPVHKMSERQVLAEMEGLPLKHRVTFRDLPWQHVIVFEKMPELQGQQ